MLFSVVGVDESYATSYYVSSVYGSNAYSGTSYTTPFLTIDHALNVCSSSDNIYLVTGSEFCETFSHKEISEDTDPYFQIIIETSDITFDEYVHPSFPGDPKILGGDPGEDWGRHLMVIDESSFAMSNITIDGYNVNCDPAYTEWNNALWIDARGDNTAISYCYFTHFGNCWTEADFYSIVVPDGTEPSSGNGLYGVTIAHNEFENNPFQHNHAHEIYVHTANGTTVEYNTIYNNCEGDPIKLRDESDGTIIRYNTVYGARKWFVNDDYTEEGESPSTDTTVENNTFADRSPAMIDVAGETYHGPVGHADHITSFKNNTIFEFDSNDSGNNKSIFGLTFNTTADSLLFPQYRGTIDEITLSSNYQAPNPINNASDPTMQFGATDTDYHCRGDICTAENYVIYSAYNAGAQRVYRNDIGDNTNDQTTFSIPADVTITALATYSDDYFLVASYNTGNDVVTIYQTSPTNASILQTSKLSLSSPSQADSITAMAYDSDTSKLAYVVRKSGYSYVYSAPIGDLTSTTLEKSFSAYCPTVTFARDNLVIAYDGGYYYGSLGENKQQVTLNNDTIIYLEGNSEYLYSVLSADSSGDAMKRIYFTQDLSDIKDQVYFYTKWFLWF